jgi:polyvinyl alcohol dehydrogenase (cytochrome)
MMRHQLTSLRIWPLIFVVALTGIGGGCASSASSSLTTASAAAANTGGGDWPTYGHDPSRTSYNADETAIGLGEVARLAPRFQATVGMGDGPSSSGPVVADGRVCVGSSVTTGNNYFCFDATTGTPVWSASIGHPADPSSGGVGIGSTAAISDGTLVVGGGDAAYYGLDAATGQIRWRSAMDVGADGFAWSSPLVADDVAYVGLSAQWTAVRGGVRALRLGDGTLLAQQSLVPEGKQGADVWNSPALSPDGATLAIATGNDYGGYDGPYTRAIVLLTPPTLDIVDTHQEAEQGQDLDFGTTPIFFHDAQGRVLVGANHKNGVFYAYDAHAVGAGPIWERHTGTQVGATPAYDPTAGAGGTLLIAGDSGVLYGVDPATGVDRWPPVAVGLSNGNMAVANGLVFVNSGGDVVVTSVADGSVARILHAAAPGKSYSGAIVAHGVVYWMSGPYLNAWSLW